MLLGQPTAMLGDFVVSNVPPQQKPKTFCIKTYLSKHPAVILF